MNYDTTNAGYTPQQFEQWYQGEFGAPIDPTFLQQIGGAVGAPGEVGAYTAAQYQQGQQMARTQQANAQPFFPEFTPPTFEQGPAYQGPAEFKAPGAFQAPTMEQAQADPGYQFALNQGMQALQNSAAARGLTRTGGTLKGLMDYGQQAASQQYDKVYGRAADRYAQDYQMGRDAWTMNTQAGRDAWTLNQGAREGAYDRTYKGASDAFNARFRGREMQFEDLYRRWRDKANIEAQMALAD